MCIRRRRRSARECCPGLASTWEGTISVAVLANVSDAREVVSLAKLLGDLEGDRDRVVITVVEDLPEFRAGARFRQLPEKRRLRRNASRN